ncbi:MAG: hypothetical protein ABJA79_10775, partial [Parafilimonas sp.]
APGAQRDTAPAYSPATDYMDLVSIIEKLPKNGAGKCIRRFTNQDIDIIKNGLEKKYKSVEEHIITSSQGQHLLLVVNNIEISISATMVYFRYKTPFSESHYNNISK